MSHSKNCVILSLDDANWLNGQVLLFFPTGSRGATGVLITVGLTSSGKFGRQTRRCEKWDHPAGFLSHRASRMKNLLHQRDPWGHSGALWIMVALVFLGPLALTSLRNLRLENNVATWLPDQDPQARLYRWSREQFPQHETVVLTWDGSTVGDPRLPLLVGRLQGKVDPDGIRRGGIPYVASVVHGEQLLQKMVTLGVDQDEAVRRLTGNLIGPGWLKVELSASGKEERERSIRDLCRHVTAVTGLEMEVCDPAREWQPGAGNEALFEQALESFADWGVVPSTEEGTETDPILIEPPAHDFQLRWAGMANHPEQVAAVSEALLSFRGFAIASEPQGRQLVVQSFQSPGSPLGMVITLSNAGEADKAGALAAIRQAAELAFIPPEALWLGGSVVAESELNSGVQRAVWHAGLGWSEWYRWSVIGLSGLVGMGFALYALRSLRLGGIVVFTAYYAAALGLALIPLTGGTMNMVLVVLPTLLMVLSLSGAIHLANYWRHAAWEEQPHAIAKATEMARTPCTMAALTTALGFLSLCASDLRPVRDFGLYAAVGTMISLGMVLYGLPALMMIVPLRRVKPDEVKPRFWLGFGAFLITHRRAVLASCLVVSLICTLGLWRFQTETKVIRYFPQNSQLVHEYQQIEDSLTGITPLEVLVSFDRASQTEYRFLERLEIVREVEEQLRGQASIRGALSLAAFQPVYLPPDADAPTRERVLFNRRSNETEKQIKEGNEGAAAQYLTTVPGESTVTSPPPWAESGAEIWRITAQVSALAPTPQDKLLEQLDGSIREVIRYYPGTSHVITGSVPVFNKTQLAVLDSLIVSFVMAFVLIGGVMAYELGDVVAGSLCMIPNILPVVSVFGLISWCGVRIDVGTMVTAAVALGIAVDGTLHQLTWFREGLRRGDSREKSVISALVHCGPAMWQTSAAISVGFLLLLPAELLLISRFGWLMALLIGAALLGDLFLLPALLMGRLGTLIESRIQRRREVSQLPEPPTPLAPAPANHVPAPHIAIPVVRRRERQAG